MTGFMGSVLVIAAIASGAVAQNFWNSPNSFLPSNNQRMNGFLQLPNNLFRIPSVFSNNNDNNNNNNNNNYQPSIPSVAPAAPVSFIDSPVIKAAPSPVLVLPSKNDIPTDPFVQPGAVISTVAPPPLNPVVPVAINQVVPAFIQPSSTPAPLTVTFAPSNGKTTKNPFEFDFFNMRWLNGVMPQGQSWLAGSPNAALPQKQQQQQQQQNGRLPQSSWYPSFNSDLLQRANFQNGGF